MRELQDLLKRLDGYLGGADYFPWALLGVGVFFTLYLGFPQFRHFGRSLSLAFGRRRSSTAEGDTTSFQALSTALSGTVGTGNIGGVALALSLGGPAALFWMWATAFVGMTTKFVEVTISHKYRVRTARGDMAGGPMYYMERGLNLRWLAIFFAVATALSAIGSGNMTQSSSIASGLASLFGAPNWASGVVLALLLGLVVLGGIRWIARVASTIVPMMSVIYVLGALAVIASNYQAVVPSFLSILEDAFAGSAAAGGFLGAGFAYALNRGVNRGLFSNEAGQGSSPIAHASARTEKPAEEGLVSLLEPFIDTLLICTLTGLAILSSGAWQDKFENDFQDTDLQFVAGIYGDQNPADVAVLAAHLDGSAPLPGASGAFEVVDGRPRSEWFTVLHNRSVAEDVEYRLDGRPFTGTLHLANGRLEDSAATLHGKSLLHSVPLTTQAFKRSFLGDYGQYAVVVCLVLFAFSTAIAWSYYGDRAVLYLFGERAVTPYRLFYVGAFFVAAVVDISLVWLISAVTLALMSLPNLIGLVLMSREVRQAERDYRDAG